MLVNLRQLALASPSIRNLHTLLILYAMCAMLVLAPIADLLPVLNRYDEKRLLECSLLLLMVAHLIIRPVMLLEWLRQYHQLARLCRLILATLLGLGIISSMFAIDSRMAILELSLTVLLVVGSIYVVIIYRSFGSLFESIITNTIIIAAGCTLLVVSMSLLAASLSSHPILHQELFGNNIHIRFFSQLQSWTLPLIVLPFMLSRTSGRAYTAMCFVIACGWWLLALTTGTRGTLLGMAVAALIVALAFGRHSKTWFKWQTLALMSGVVLYISLFILPTLISGGETNAVQDGSLRRSITSSSGRFHLWEIAWNMIKDNPWFGAGPMHYACGVNHAGFAAHPHNAVLQIAAEWGLPAAVMVVLLVLWGVTAWIRQGRALMAGASKCTDKAFLYPVLLASLTAAATHALFSGIIVMPLSQLILILIVGWMIGQYTGQHSQGQAVKVTRHYGRCRTLFWLGLFVLAALGLLQGMLPALYDFGDLLNRAQMPENNGIYAPRFWQQGLFCPENP